MIVRVVNYAVDRHRSLGNRATRIVAITGVEHPADCQVSVDVGPVRAIDPDEDVEILGTHVDGRNRRLDLNIAA
jgi:hypothetical protein